jgi:hypothetical protein
MARVHVVKIDIETHDIDNVICVEQLVVAKDGECEDINERCNMTYIYQMCSMSATNKDIQSNLARHCYHSTIEEFISPPLVVKTYKARQLTSSARADATHETSTLTERCQ